MINLSQFLNKKVQITLRNSLKEEGWIRKNGLHSSIYPYIFRGGMRPNAGYFHNGRVHPRIEEHDADIVHIEELKPVVDLSQFVGKNVRVTFRNGNTDSGIIGTTAINPMFPYVYTGRSLKEYYNIDGLRSYENHLVNAWDITQIEEIKPMVDLSQFVGKRVLVNLRCGFEFTGFILPPDSIGSYMFAKDGGMIPRVRYTKDGGYDDIGRMSGQGANDIIHIEELKPMNKYKELEKQVAEMQKEIERLKGEEKNHLNLKPVEITRTVQFTPKEYFEHCEDHGEKPTARGYVQYYSRAEWFMDSGNYTEEFRVLDV